MSALCSYASRSIIFWFLYASESVFIAIVLNFRICVNYMIIYIYIIMLYATIYYIIIHYMYKLWTQTLINSFCSLPPPKLKVKLHVRSTRKLASASPFRVCHLAPSEPQFLTRMKENRVPSRYPSLIHHCRSTFSLASSSALSSASTVWDLSPSSPKQHPCRRFPCSPSAPWWTSSSPTPPSPTTTSAHTQR